jgi:biopolymer transport protein ExbD
MLTQDKSAAAEKPRLMPMIDVAFLIIIFFMSLPLKTLDGKIETFLPKDQGIGSQEEAKAPPPRVRISVRQRGEDFTYRIGRRRFTSHYDLIPLLKKLGDENVYEIDGTPHLPNQAVMNVIDLLHGLKYDVQFRGGLRLTRQVRTMYLLPKLD